MKRRDVITLLGGAAALALPSAALAQPARRMPSIGFIGAATEQGQRHLTAAFVERLRELGWIADKTVTIEYRWAEGSAERAATAAADFAARKVDIIVAGGTQNVLAAKRVAAEIPIVFAAGDPVGTGLVASLSHPGGNLTGLSLQTSEIAGKHLELLRSVVPDLRRVAMLVNVGAKNAVEQMREAQRVAPELGLEMHVLEIKKVEDIADAIGRAKGVDQALYVANEPLTLTHRARIAALAFEARLPTVYGYREFVETGGLMSYGPSFPDLFRRAADFADKILRGAKPAELPVEQPTKFNLVVNLKTAKALGLAVPITLLGRADEVIE